MKNLFDHFEEECKENQEDRRFPGTGNHLSGRCRERSRRRIRSDQIPSQCRRSSGFRRFKEIIEPLRDLFKDEVRKAGLELGIPEKLVFRQPFPGPGLGIRIIGEVNAEKVRIVQDADYIYRDEVDKAVAAYKAEHGTAPSWMPNQYFAALTNMRSVGVMGDERTYDYAVALRAVNTVDFMTAEAAEIPFAVLQSVMSRIINEVRGVNRVFYDLTSKPPGTIEFE